MPKDLRRSLSMRASTSRGEMSGTFTKRLDDSTEHMVAHVEQELAGSRLLPSTTPGVNEKRAETRLRTSRIDAEPLVLIDGKRASTADMAALDERQIASVSIYKDSSAAALSSDPAAKNGVMYISTRRAKKH